MPRRSSGGSSFGGGSSFFSRRSASSSASLKTSASSSATLKTPERAPVKTSSTSHKTPAPARGNNGSASSKTPAPAKVAPAPAPMQAGSATGGFGSSFVDGLGFGAGNAVGHRAVDGVLGPRTIRYETVASPAPATESSTMATLGGSDACGFQVKDFVGCLNTSVTDISKCQFYMDMLCECRKNSGAGLTGAGLTA